jgi:hypothetical protein
VDECQPLVDGKAGKLPKDMVIGRAKVGNVALHSYETM